MRLAVVLLLTSLASAVEPAASIQLLLSKPRAPTADEFVAAVKATGMAKPDDLEALRTAFRPNEMFLCTLRSRTYRITYTKKSAYSNLWDALESEKDKRKRIVIRKHRGHVALRANERGKLSEHYKTLAKLAAALWGKDVMAVRFSWSLHLAAKDTQTKLLAKDPLKAFGIADRMLRKEPKLDPVDEAFRDAAFEAHTQFGKFKRMYRLHAKKKDDVDAFCVYVADPARPRGLIRLLVTGIRGTKISGYRVDDPDDVLRYDPAREMKTDSIWIQDWTYRDHGKVVGDFRRKELEKRGLLKKAGSGK